MTPVQKTKMSNFRWVICALLFLATTINYMDRQVLSLTWKDFIAPEFHLIDRLEEMGICSGANGSKPRELIMSREQFEAKYGTDEDQD